MEWFFEEVNTMFLRDKSGQSTLEYVILTGFVVAALIGMGAYMKRGMQGRLRESTDQIGQQYSAGNTTSDFTTETTTSQTESVSGGITTTEITDNTMTKTGSEQVGALDLE
jgi:Flp pilus assembly pilin Flp